jgi:DNA (cytosine-5)-methyltransferase 1
MDTPQTITHISLCAGYGGIDLGLRRAIQGLRTIAFSEIEGYAAANLVAKMEAGLLDPAPIWTNLKTFPWAAFRDRVDILSGGYPCQPFSAAGKRLGGDDPRHLWPYIARGIRILQPRVCFFENVEGHISLGLSDVIEDLAGMGYRTTWGIFSASEVGAPHQRKRVFIMAHNQRQRVEELNRRLADGAQQHPIGNNGSHAWPSRPGEQQHGWEPPRVVGNAHRSRPQEREGQGGPHVQRADSDDRAASSRPTQPSLGGDTDGSTSGLDYAELSVTCDNRTDELRLLGNGVVPATATRAFLTLVEELNESPTLSTSSS